MTNESVLIENDGEAGESGESGGGFEGLGGLEGLVELNGKELCRRGTFRRKDDYFLDELSEEMGKKERVEESLELVLEALEKREYVCPRIYRKKGEKCILVRKRGKELEGKAEELVYEVRHPIFEETIIKNNIYHNKDVLAVPDLIRGADDPLNFIREKALIGVPYERGKFKYYGKEVKGAILLNYDPEKKIVDEMEIVILHRVGRLVGEKVRELLALGLLEEANRKLEEANKKLDLQVKLDGPTGLYNKKTFHEDLEDYLKEAKEKGTPYYLILMDCDGLKKLNDGFGHPTGDKFISALGEFLRSINSIYRAGYRFGGDEFALVVETDSTERVFSLAEKIRQGIQGIPVPRGYQPLTASLGIMKAARELKDGERWYYEADEIALYEAKRRGGNKIISYEQRNKLYEIEWGEKGDVRKIGIKQELL